MIDGDDIINIAIETGYRISVCNKNDIKKWNNTFSSNLCPNNKRKIYYCSQNGLIKLINQKVTDKNENDVILSSTSDNKVNEEESNNNEIYFHLLFRKFSAITPDRKTAMATPEARPILQHWDKMCLIPHRPGEVLFLIGVSKTLYYSAFPGECSPVAKSPLTAYVKRRNPGFAYGTPVVEIVHHNVRITCAEVLPKTGNFLATGDENGFVKVMMLIRPRHLHHTIDSRNTHQLNFRFKSVTEQTTGIRMHNGPIFALRWVKSMNFEEKMFDEMKEALGEEDDEQKEYLVSGSADRCVKV